jgi:hypothetical protein
MDLVKFLADNPNVKGDVIARLGPFSSIPPDKVQESIELAKVLQNAEKRRESGEASAAAFTSLSTDPRTGLPGPAATLGAQAAQTPALRGDFSQFVQGIQQLPPEQRVRETNRLASSIQAVPGAQQGVALQSGFQTGLDVSRARELSQVDFDFQQMAADRGVFRAIDVAEDLGLYGPKDPQTGRTNTGDRNRRLQTFRVSVGEAAIDRQMELDSQDTQLLHSVVDLEGGVTALEAGLEIARNNPGLFGATGTITRFTTGLAGALQQFASLAGSPEQQQEILNRNTDQFSWALENQGTDDAVEAMNEIVSDVTKGKVKEVRTFLADEAALGSFEAYELGAIISFARANTRGGRLTRVALDEARQQVNFGGIAGRGQVEARIQGVINVAKSRQRGLERIFSGAAAGERGTFLNEVKEAARLSTGPNPVAEPTLRPEGELGRRRGERLRNQLDEETRKEMTKEERAFEDELRGGREAETTQGPPSPEEGAFRVTPATVRSALEAVGSPGGGRNPTDEQNRLVEQARNAAARRFQSDPGAVSNQELALLLTMPRFADRAEAEFRKRGGIVTEGL